MGKNSATTFKSHGETWCFFNNYKNNNSTRMVEIPSFWLKGVRKSFASLGD
jgi:hypothetical protein